MKVFVYYNLHRKLWSVKALEGEHKGKVIAHRHEVVLHKPKPKVSEAGRQRVLHERRKNVHAGLVGDWLEQKCIQPDGDLITYNPYKYTSFVYADNEQPFTGASLAIMQDSKVYVI
jgi:uncharacterized protein YvpB